jgi:hypothetical protein
VNLDSLIRVDGKGGALELSAALQCTGKHTPLSIYMRFTTTVLTLGISRAQNNCLNELALVGTHTRPESETRCIAALGLSRIESGFCFDDVRGRSAEREGVAESDVFLSYHTSYGGGESTKEETTVDHCGGMCFERM